MKANLTVTAPIDARPGAPLFCASPAMQVVLEQVARAAESGDHVLVVGEPGTGREVIAREIHRRAVSADAGFVQIDCAGHTPDELELELFGCRTESADRQNLSGRAAFESVTRGCGLHRAFGGTLFFEHVTEMPSRIQARLARIFRDGEVMAGDGKVVEVDVRAIAAVEAGYDEAAAEGRILGELHRLVSSIRIEMPLLRERREDIPALAMFFVEDLCKRAQVPRKELSLPVQQLIAALPWYGNASELRTLVDGLVPRVAAHVIELHDLLAVIQLDGRAQPLVVGGSLREARSRFEREYVAAVLEQHRGRIPEAARTLGIQRTNLYRKIKRLRLQKRREA